MPHGILEQLGQDGEFAITADQLGLKASDASTTVADADWTLYPVGHYGIFDTFDLQLDPGADERSSDLPLCRLSDQNLAHFSLALQPCRQVHRGTHHGQFLMKRGPHRAEVHAAGVDASRDGEVEPSSL